MKIAIISDIHANLAALLAVISDMKKQNIQLVFCLGDIVGYGPYPVQCLKLVRKYAKVIIRGNHEEGVINPKYAALELNDNAIAGIDFSRSQINDNWINYIRSLQFSKTVPEYQMALAHGAFVDKWRYVDTVSKAIYELENTLARICFVGHTHVPFVYGSEYGLYETLPDNLELDEKQKFMINVGSVGQPRDGDCRASYGVIDVGINPFVFNLRRVFYDIGETERAMQKFKLPTVLSERLFMGE